MNCPVSNVDIGERCSVRDCWLWHRKGRASCAALTVGTTNLTERDVARLNGETLVAARERLARGRAKLSAWLALVDHAENADEEYPAVDAAAVAEVAETLPLDRVITMTPTRWAAVIATLRGDRVTAVSKLVLT